VPEAFGRLQTKPDIALAEIDRVRAAGVRFGCVLADAGYGLSAPFRQGLSERGLVWAVGIPFKPKFYQVGVTMIFPIAGRGSPRKRHVPDTASVSAQAMLEETPWRMLSWRRGTKGRLQARFAARRVRVADGPPQRIDAMGAQHLPGEEVWLIGEHRSNGERSTICPTCLPTPRSRAWPARSRRAGSVSRRISS
jgi:SRSO17 transposase